MIRETNLVSSLFKKILFIVFLFSLSCAQDETSEEENSSQDIDLIDDDDVILETTEIVIDSTDLVNLPVDTGGTHTAYPLHSTSARFGHHVYTPSGYTQDGPEYPLLVYLHGWDPSGYTGSDVEELDELLGGATSPPSLITRNRWNPSFPFIVASPRLKNYTYWAHFDIHSFITYLIENYQINEKRIYLTGLSLGGGGTWYYVGERGDDNYVAAIVPISASGEPRIIDNLTNIPIWAFHGDRDATVDAFTNYGSVTLVEEINAKNPKIPAKITLFTNTGHDAWTRPYSDTFTPHATGDPFDVSIYDWMLQYKKE